MNTIQRVIILLLSLSFLLTACSKQSQTTVERGTSTTVTAEEQDTLSFDGLDDSDLHRYVQDNIYQTVVETLNSDEYFVENVSTNYISKEYLEELAFNSEDNVFFGYNLKSLEEQFQGTKFVFSTDEKNKTVVKEFEEYDDTYEQVIKNVAIGSGVILVCVTVSAVSAPAAPAVSMILAYSAKTGAIAAASSGVLGGATAGIIEGVHSKDLEKAKKAAALEGSKAFKWGAITGALAGGSTEAIGLRGATTNGLTMNEAANIQKESKYPLDVIKQMKSMEEYNVYKEAGLKTMMVDGKLSLVQDIDLTFNSTTADGEIVSNLELMVSGKPPIDPVSGKPIELHHMNQSKDGTLAMLTRDQHRGKGNFSKLHNKWSSDVHKTTEAKKAWADTVSNYWKDYAYQVGGAFS